MDFFPLALTHWFAGMVFCRLPGYLSSLALEIGSQILFAYRSPGAPVPLARRQHGCRTREAQASAIRRRVVSGRRHLGGLYMVLDPRLLDRPWPALRRVARRDLFCRLGVVGALRRTDPLG